MAHHSPVLRQSPEVADQRKEAFVHIQVERRGLVLGVAGRRLVAVDHKGVALEGLADHKPRLAALEGVADRRLVALRVGPGAHMHRAD